MKKTANALVGRYLDELRRLTSDLPPARQQELIADIAAHIDAALGELPGAGDEDVRRVLAEVGDPHLIAEEARHEDAHGEGDAREPVSAVAVVAVVAGGLSLLVPIFGTLLAIVVVWVASRGPHHGRNQGLIRLAAVIVAAVAVVHLAVFVLFFPASFDTEVDVRPSEVRLLEEAPTPPAPPP